MQLPIKMEDQKKTASRLDLPEIDWFFRFSILPDELSYIIEEYRRAEYLRMWKKNYARRMVPILDQLCKVTQNLHNQLNWMCQYDRQNPHDSTRPMDWSEFNRLDPLEYGWVEWPVVYRKHKSLASDDIYWTLEE